MDKKVTLTLFFSYSWTRRNEVTVSVTFLLTVSNYLTRNNLKTKSWFWFLVWEYSLLWQETQGGRGVRMQVTLFAGRRQRGMQGLHLLFLFIRSGTLTQKGAAYPCLNLQSSLFKNTLIDLMLLNLMKQIMKMTNQHSEFRQVSDNFSCPWTIFTQGLDFAAISLTQVYLECWIFTFRLFLYEL